MVEDNTLSICATALSLCVDFSLLMAWFCLSLLVLLYLGSPQQRCPSNGVPCGVGCSWGEYAVVLLRSSPRSWGEGPSTCLQLLLQSTGETHTHTHIHTHTHTLSQSITNPPCFPCRTPLCLSCCNWLEKKAVWSQRSPPPSSTSPPSTSTLPQTCKFWFLNGPHKVLLCLIGHDTPSTSTLPQTCKFCFLNGPLKVSVSLVGHDTSSTSTQTPPHCRRPVSSVF